MMSVKWFYGADIRKQREFFPDQRVVQCTGNVPSTKNNVHRNSRIHSNETKCPLSSTITLFVVNERIRELNKRNPI